MQFGRLIDVLTFLLHDEILAHSSQKLFGSHAVQVLHHPVIVNNSQLVGREAHSHEIVVLFVTTVIGVLLGFLRTHQSGSGAAMMPIGNVEGGHLGKLLGYGINVLLLVYNPKGMTETITRSDKVVYRFPDCITGNDGIQRSVIGIGKEYGLNVGIVHADMLHTVLLFITTSQLVLLDNAVHIIGNIGTDNKTVLCLAVHGLGIDVIVFFIVLHQPAFLLEHTEVLCSFLINTFVMLIRTDGKIYFRLDNMI